MARPGRRDATDTAPRNLGRYRLYGELAAGGMATVHLARQIGSGGFSKMVAIKRLHPQFAKLDQFIDMFFAEARLAARIRHPNVVPPLDVLRVEDEIFLVMEYVEGDSLSRLLKACIVRQEKIPFHVAVSIASGVLRGLHAAHEAKSDKGEPLEIIHRDVSPQNVLVGVDGNARVIDFGIAKASDSVEVTEAGTLKGKLAYMAPELLTGARITRRADVYAASVVLWESLTAQRLFDADSQSAVLANVLHRQIEPPSVFLADLPPALDAVVMKGLARNPEDRFATAREMAVALEEAYPPAGPAVVGEWVESIAEISLTHRGKRVAFIEAHTEDEDEEEAEEVLSALITVASPDEGPPPVPPRPLPVRPLPTRTVPPTSGRQPTTVPPGALLPPPSLSFSPADLAAPAWPVPGIAPSASGAKVEMGPEKRSSGSGIVVFMLAVALVATVLYIGLPELLKRSYVTAAARQGVTASIDSVEIGLGKVRVLGVTASMADLPGVTAHAKSVDVSFSARLDPTDASLHELLFTVDGTGSGFEESVRRFALAHPASSMFPPSLRLIAVDAGHLVWSRALGEGTKVEAENISLTLEGNGKDPLGDDVSFATSLVGVTAPWGKLGPWSANGQAEHGVWKTTLTLDPSGASKAAATFTIDHGTVTAFDLTLPRSAVALLGVGISLAARRPEDAFYAEGEAHYAVRSASRVEGMLRLAMSGVKLPLAMTGADVQVEGHIDGDPTHAIDVTKGVFAFGPFRGTVAGSVTVGDPFVKADLALRTPLSRCPTGGDASVSGTVSFDTRALSDAHLAVSPAGKCPLRIFPP
jgi:serine/threonine-protein kinase